MLRSFITKRLAPRLLSISHARVPDVVIGGAETPYMRRWFIIPRNRWFNIYLHHFLRSDDDRALHDHPWINLSILLHGSYVEHTVAAGGSRRRVHRRAGDMKLRMPSSAHRVELLPGASEFFGEGHPEHGWSVLRLAEAPCWTLFITGPNVRSWGFHCPQGWRHWRDFTSADGREVGRGCGEDGAQAFFAFADRVKSSWKARTCGAALYIFFLFLMYHTTNALGIVAFAWLANLSFLLVILTF